MGAGYAAIIIRREKDLVSHFEQMRATSPTAAQSLESLRVTNDQYFRRLERRAVIRRSDTGLYYLDEPSWNAVNATRRRMVLIVLVLALAGAAAAAYTAVNRDSGEEPAATSPV